MDNLIFSKPTFHPGVYGYPIRGLAVVLLAGLLLSPAWANANPWSKQKHPAKLGELAQSIGAYDAGCLAGAVSLPVNGAGYQVMRLSRQRFYGHPVLTQFIEALGKQAAQRQLGTLLIGDLGQPRGGPTLTGHRSHQTGLDVDIWFLLSDQAASRPLTPQERETLGAPSVLLGNSENINKNHWSRSQEQILKLAAEDPAVDRIFVNPSIKRELCVHYREQNWLRKIRPWWKHDDHFHVRLKCPGNNPHCEGQAPLPAGDGCDASLAWWFSEEAKKPSPQPYKPKKPVLPALCDELLRL